MRWNASRDRLTAEIERAEWMLTDDDEGVAVLRDLVCAASAGRFFETVDDDGKIIAVATTADGRAYEATAAVSRFPLGGTVVMTAGSGFARVQRARSDEPFRPWSGDA